MLYDLKREISAEARRLRNGRKKREKVDEPGFPELSEAKKKGREEICDSFSSGKVGLNHSSANMSPASLKSPSHPIPHNSSSQPSASPLSISRNYYVRVCFFRPPHSSCERRRRMRLRKKIDPVRAVMQTSELGVSSFSFAI